VGGVVWDDINFPLLNVNQW